MTRINHTAVGGDIIAVALALGTLSAGAGASPPLSLDPTSGPPGTEITVSGEDCSTKGDTWVTLELLDTTGTVQDTAETDVVSDGFGGDWEATLAVPAATTDYGEWSVEATCEVRFGEFEVESARAGRSVVLPAQTRSEPLFDYTPAPFTVTAPVGQPTPTSTPTPTTAPPATAPVVAQPTYTG